MMSGSATQCLSAIESLVGHKETQTGGTKVGKYRIPFLGGTVAVILAGSALAATPAFAGVKGNDNLGIDGNLVGTLTISKHHVFSDVSGNSVTDSGTWAKAKHEKAITLTITSSSYPADVGCVLSGTVVKNGINTASSPGPYTCSNGPAGPSTGTWYAVKSGASGVHRNANVVNPSRGFAG
jgi:hypothetical protein